MKREDLIEKILDKQIRPTTEGKGFSYNGFPLYHKLTKSDANQIIELCQPQWVRKDQEIGQHVTNLRDIAIKYEGCQKLREHIRREV